MARYEENAAWNIPPTKIRVIRNLLALGALLGADTKKRLDKELQRVLRYLYANDFTVPKDLEGPLPSVKPSRQLLKKTLARAVLLDIPEDILREVSLATGIPIPDAKNRMALYKEAQLDPAWEKYLVK